MEKQEPDSIQAFDALYTTNQIQILKLLLPFCPPQTQRSLAVLIRLLELNYTIGFVRSHPEAFHAPPDSLSLPDLCAKIRGFCPPQLQAMLDQLMSFQNAMQMYEQIKPLLELFAEQSADSGSPQDTDGSFPPDTDSGSSQDTDSGSPQGAKTQGKETRDKEVRDKEVQNGNDAPGRSADPLPDPAELLAGMLSPSQWELFQMLQKGFQTAEDAGSPDRKKDQKENVSWQNRPESPAG